MLANYHTHTFRCGHAVGAEAEYASAAATAGLRILGFSDHTPYSFLDDVPREFPIRMKSESLPEYARTVRALAEAYRGTMEIHVGVEAEYYPRYFPQLLELLRENGIEYMLLGQHFLDNEIGSPHCGRPTEDEALLDRYVSQVSEALETGLFTYLAHPDIFRFVGDAAVYERHMRKLCRKAIETDTPLEINLLGIREHRDYPNETFWRIAAEEGCPVILGCDAHRPEDVCDPASEKKALELVERLGFKRIETLPLRLL